ncbi:MAG: hypothetical protein Kow00121_28180 [Elainellaceae cyanobacterium]
MAIGKQKDNTLATAQNLRKLDTKSLVLRNSVSSTDVEDLYRLRLGSYSQFALQVTGVRRQTRIALEIFAPKGKARNVLRKIGRFDFSSLSNKQIRRHLNQIAQQRPALSGTNLTTLLDPGLYYLRVSSLKNKTRYRLQVTASPPIATPPVLTPTPAPVDSVTPSPSPSPTPTPSPATTTLLYSGSGLPKEQDWLDFGQIPILSGLNLPPFFSNTVKTASQTPETTGVRLNTELFTGSNAGYVGYSNYTASPANPTLRLVNSSFPTLDRTEGFTLNFQLAVETETSTANRAGFSLLLLDSEAKGIELGFKNDRIFAQSSTFTAAESVTPSFNLNQLKNYSLKIQSDGYQLFADNVLLLNGSLRNYEFDPLNSNPPLPNNPYQTPNLLFFGDNTDQGRSTVTLGAISLLN